MRFSDTRSGKRRFGLNRNGERADDAGLASAGLGEDSIAKFVVGTIGAGFLAIAGLALWILWVAKTGAHGPREIGLSVLACVPFGIAAFVAKTKLLKHGQTMMTGVIVAALTATGTLLPQWSHITIMLLTLVPVLAVNHLARFSVLGAALVAMTGIAVTLHITNVVDPLRLAASCGLHVIASMFSLQTKLKLEGLRAKNGSIEKQLQQYALSDADLVTRHDADGLTLSASAASCTLLGVKPDALLNLGLHDKVHVQDRVAMLKTISDAAATGKRQTCELRIRCKTGSHAGWKSVSMQSIAERDQVTGAVIVESTMHDISSTREQMEQAQWGGESAREAHEYQQTFIEKLRTEVQKPITALVSKTAALDEKDASQAYVVMAVSKIQRSLDELIESSEVEVGQYSISSAKFAVMDAIAASIKALQPTLSTAGIKVVSDVPASIPAMHSDRVIVTRIFKNVLTAFASQAVDVNTITLKARPHGAHIRFHVECGGELSDIEMPADWHVTNRLVSALGGTFEETKRSAGCLVISITLPVRSRADAAFTEQIKSKNHEQTSEGESRARLSA